jgi:hypothetical protein
VSTPIVTPKPAPDPVRIRRLRKDAERPMSTSLVEGIALSHALLRFTGVARERSAGRTRDLADLEDLDAAHEET